MEHNLYVQLTEISYSIEKPCRRAVYLIPKIVASADSCCTSSRFSFIISLLSTLIFKQELVHLTQLGVFQMTAQYRKEGNQS